MVCKVKVCPREGRTTGDVAFSGITSEADFQKRVRTLNFDMGKYFELRVGEPWNLVFY